MIKGNERFHGESAFVHHKSLVFLTSEEALSRKAEVLKREWDLLMFCSKRVSGKNYPFSGLESKAQMTFEKAQIKAGMEAGRLIFGDETLESLVIRDKLPEFPPLYRFLRTLELAFGFPRGGKTLLVGSGITVPEALAVSIMPHTDRVSVNKKTQIVAVEPDQELLKIGHKLVRFFRLTKHILKIENCTIGEAIEQGRIPDDLDSIIWQRADPEIFSEKHEVILREDETKTIPNTVSIVGSLFSHLKLGGFFVYTVGSGNNSQELRSRLQSLRAMRYVLPKIGADVVYNRLSFFKTEEDALSFGNSTYGAIGAIVGRKQ